VPKLKTPFRDVTTLDYSGNLQQHATSFVTLHKYGQLRGCIGALETYQPLIDDIVECAFSAAFRDPCFPTLENNETEPMAFTGEEDLFVQVSMVLFLSLVISVADF